MADVQHNALTGSNLHEPKGVAAAAASKVYLSDGAASGAWSFVPLAALEATAKAFQGQLAHFKDSKASGTAGGSITVGSYAAREITDSVTLEISGASRSGNTVTLPAGTFFTWAFVRVHNTAGSSARDVKAKIRNTSDGSDVLVGMGLNLTSGEEGVLTIGGRFTLAAPKDVQIQMQASAASVTAGGAVSFGDAEVYLDWFIFKVA